MSEVPIFSKRQVEAMACQVSEERLVAEVVRAVCAYRPIRSELICAIANQRLGEYLADSNFISRMEEASFIRSLQIPQNRGTSYVLDDAGRCYVRWKLGWKSVPKCVIEMYSRQYSRLNHDTLTSDVMSRLLLDIIELGGQVDWRWGWNSPDKGNHYGARWDAYAYVRFWGLRYTFVFEMDCGTETIPEFAAKAGKYEEYLEIGTWEEALGCKGELPILVVTTGEDERMIHMRRAISDELAWLGQTAQRWWFTNIPRLRHSSEAGVNPLAAAVWDYSDGRALMHPILPYSQLLAEAMKAADRTLYNYDRATSVEQLDLRGGLEQLQMVVARLQLLV